MNKEQAKGFQGRAHPAEVKHQESTHATTPPKTATTAAANSQRPRSSNDGNGSELIAPLSHPHHKPRDTNLDLRDGRLDARRHRVLPHFGRNVEQRSGGTLLALVLKRRPDRLRNVGETGRQGNGETGKGDVRMNRVAAIFRFIPSIQTRTHPLSDNTRIQLPGIHLPKAQHPSQPTPTPIHTNLVNNRLDVGRGVDKVEVLAASLAHKARVAAVVGDVVAN